MNGTSENHRRAALRVAIVIACVVAAGVLAFRFGNHFFVWLKMDKSLKAVPCVDVESLEKAGMGDVRFREHKIGDSVLYVPADAEAVDEDCAGDDGEGRHITGITQDDDVVIARFSVPSLKASLDIVVEKPQTDYHASFGPFMNATMSTMLGEDLNVAMQGEEGLAEFHARSLATSSADFRWSDTPSQVMDFAARCKLREWMQDTKQYFFERVKGADVLIVMDSSTKFAMMIECRSHLVYYVTLELEEESADGVYHSFAFLRRMASFYANPPEL